MKCLRNTKGSLKDLIDQFEEIRSFNYLGVHIDKNNSRVEESRRRIQSGNKAYYANKILLKDKTLTKETKLKIYKTLIRPVFTYAAETMCMLRMEAKAVLVLERKILRTILGPKKDENG